MKKRFLALIDSPQTLSYVYDTSVSSAKQVINMFLDVVDSNDTFDPLQVKLPYTTNLDALHDLAER